MALISPSPVAINKRNRIPEGCAIAGIISTRGRPISGEYIAKAMEPMRPRYNGLGGGFAGYGIYPKYRDYYALHIMFYSEKSREVVEELLAKKTTVVKDENIPVKSGVLKNEPILRRYFVDVPPSVENSDDYILELVMYINDRIENAFVMSSGKNMGVFKAVGDPLTVADFYNISQYKGYMWLGHGRYPTNTPGWWGGAHPFNILSWSVIHNGEVSSYGTNKRYVEEWGYKCTLLTDTEVFAYLFDLLVRKHNLPVELACTAMAPPFWHQIDNMDGGHADLIRAIRITYAPALVNGPFSIIVGTECKIKAMIGLTDRIKLRPLVAAIKDDFGYISSEECAIREVCPDPDKIWFVKAGSPVIMSVEN